MRLTKIKQTCKLCGINLYVETDNKPDPRAMPCGIDRTNEEEKIRCPYETAEEQAKNAGLTEFKLAGLGEIAYG
jgi:lipoate-protein ligase B